jgi:hypothetical protein
MLAYLWLLSAKGLTKDDTCALPDFWNAAWILSGAERRNRIAQHPKDTQTRRYAGFGLILQSNGYVRAQQKAAETGHGPIGHVQSRTDLAAQAQPA